MRNATWSRLLLVLLCLLPLIILFLLPGVHVMTGTLWFWGVFLLTLLVVWLLLGAPEEPMRERPAPESRRVEPHVIPGEQIPAVVGEIMQVRVATEQDGVSLFRGSLSQSPEQAYDTIRQAVGDRYLPLLRDDPEFGTAVVLLPKATAQAELSQRSSTTVNWLLFALTILTTTFAGAAHQGVNLLQEPARFGVGLPYSLGLLAILGVHEMGHFFTARYHGIHVTPPFFIPVPFALGTFGAFIQMKSPTETRKALFDVAVAGPLAGLAIAIPALLIGLRNSEVVPGGMEVHSGGLVNQHGTSVGSSMLLALIAKLALPDALQTGCTVRLSPLAFAGWLGLIVTALNLIPVGQLDGGHTVRAMFGSRIGGMIGNIAMWTLFLLALFVWPALLMWAIIVFFIAGRGMPPLNDVTTISPGRRLIGYLTFLILVLILAPVPHSLLSEIGIYCPYV
jgi:membrane-associated protease RseP (regulator of RpoE activity)